MSPRLPRLLSALLAAAFALPATAQTYPVDDSASQVVQAGLVRMRWDSLVPQRGQRPTIQGQVTVLVRLDVSPWQGRSGRIYQKLASVPAGPVTVRWSATGPLLPGSVRDGERTLVYSGPLATPRLEDTFQMVIQADGERVQRPQDLSFSFEIELETP